MKASEKICCHGHPLIKGTHSTTFEITTEKELTFQGDCIIGVGADKGAADLNPAFSRLLARDSALLYTSLQVGSYTAYVQSRGSPRITLSHPTDLVWRRSTYVDARTIGIGSDQVAATLPRTLITLLRQEEDMIVEMNAVIPE
ncbi:MAG: DUF371 domain-containing protein [Methanomicrobiales archaeon]|nr:DUF371 domain-containing protein [Methanomicrobiales archaeon]